MTQCLVESELKRRVTLCNAQWEDRGKQTGRERGRAQEVTTGHARASLIPTRVVLRCFTENTWGWLHLSRYYRVFRFVPSPNFTASLKRKSIYHSAQMRESLNRWRTSTQRQRFPIGPPATCKMVWIAVVTNVVLVNHSCLLGGFACFGCKTFLFSLWTCVIPNWPPQSSPTSPSSYQSATFVHACFHWLPNIKQKSIKHWIKASNNHQKELWWVKNI